MNDISLIRHNNILIKFLSQAMEIYLHNPWLTYGKFVS